MEKLCANGRITLVSLTLCSTRERGRINAPCWPARTELREPSLVHPAWPALPVRKKTSDAHVSVTLRCEFLLLGGLRRHTTSCLHLRELSGVTSNRERFVSIDGSVPIEHRFLHVETHHCCTKATASCELNFFSLEKTWVLFCAVRLRAEQRNVHMARAGAAVVEASEFRVVAVIPVLFHGPCFRQCERNGGHGQLGSFTLS